MSTCECPLCDRDLSLRGYEEDDVIECPHCGTSLEVVSLDPPVVETPLEDDDTEGWNDFSELD